MLWYSDCLRVNHLKPDINNMKLALTFVILNPNLFCFRNTVDPDQMALSEAI